MRHPISACTAAAAPHDWCYIAVMLRWLANALLRAGGWTAVGEPPDIPKAVFIAAPHTSNWDGVWALAYKVVKDIDIRFFAKDSLFWFPLGTILTAFGGIALDRNDPGAAVKKAIEQFDTNERFYFGLAPEGTRSLRDHWKSGFYRIAEGANVPVVLGFLDYRNKRLGLGPTLYVSGDRDADLAKIREFYAGVEGRWPEKTSPVRFAP